jgi:hypothetical protein
MPTLDWLKKEFNYGYSSGNILSWFPGRRVRYEEKRCGGSYKNIFFKGVLPYLKNNSKVLELGPGAGSWSRPILKYIPDGELTTLDFQDVEPWLKPQKYNGRLKCYKIENNDYSFLPDNYFDLFFSFGVLCHNNSSLIKEILSNALTKMKNGGYAVHMHGNWNKLDKFGWERGTVPVEFKDKPDDEIWWPRNNSEKMKSVAEEAGWKVLNPDLNLIERDSIILLQK